MKGVHGVCIRMHVRTNMYVCTNALMTVCTTTTTTTTGRVPEEVPSMDVPLDSSRYTPLEH